MKKLLAAVLAVAMAPAISSADTIGVDPLMLSYGGIGLSYEHNTSDKTAYVFEYGSYEQDVIGTKVSAGIIGFTYKKAFDGNKLGNGAFWRAGISQVTVGINDSVKGPISLSGILPSAAVGYDWSLSSSWNLRAEVGLGILSMIQIGYKF